MEDLDSHSGAGSKPAAGPTSRSPSNRGSLSSSGPKPRGSGSGRTASAGISAWGKDDNSWQGADQTSVPSKADSVGSGANTPRNHSGRLTGDGNLAQAILAGRRAAELERRSSSGSGSTGHRSSVGGLDPNTDAVLRAPGRLSRASDHEQALMAPSDPGEHSTQREGKSAFIVGDVIGDGDAAGPVTGAEYPSRTEGGDESPLADASGDPTVEVESTDASWPAPVAAPVKATSGTSTGAGSGGGKDLRGLLYSDDEGGDDDDYQDLMTADDEALFGGTAGEGGDGAGRSGAGGEDAPDVEGDGEVEGDGAPTGVLEAEASAAQAQPVRGSSASSSRSSPRGTPPGRQASQNGGSGRSGRRGSCAAAPEDVANDTENHDPEGLSLEIAVPATASALDVARSAWGSEGGVLSEPPSISPSPHPPLEGSMAELMPPEPGPHSGPDVGGPLDGRAGGPHEPGMEEAPVAMFLLAPAPARATIGPDPFIRPPEDPRINQAYYQQQQHAQLVLLHHHNLHQQQQQQQQGALQGTGHQALYASLPTAMVGEGLRQHPPVSRRVYTPGQNNRSPVRGSGYVVSPAAVRPPSPPSSSPSRAAHQHYYPTGPGRRNSSSHHAAMAVTATQLARPRSPRDPHVSGLSTGGLTPSYDGGEGLPPEHHPGGVSVINFGFAPPSTAAAHVQQTQMHGGVLMPGGGMRSGSASAGGFAPSGHFGRFPPAAVQHFAGGQVYRSMPISQVAGSASDEAAAAGVPGTAPGGGPGPAQGRSPGRLSGPAARQSRASGLGPVGSSGAFLGHMRDRYGSSSAPARPLTSPLRSPRGSSGTSRSPIKRNTHTGPLSPGSATAVFGNGVLSDPADGGAYGAAPPPVHHVVSVTAAPLRTLAVPSLPPYGAPAGIRHCGFKPAAGPAAVGGGGGQAAAAAAQLYGSSFSGSRQKANDERMRSAMLAKVIASVAAKEQQQQQYQHFAGTAPHDLSMINALPIPQSPGAAVADAAMAGIAAVPPFDSGQLLPGNVDGWMAAAAAAAAAGGGSGAVGSASSFSAELSMQLQRKGSLPQLLAASYHAENGGGGQYVGYGGHGPSHLKPSTSPPPVANLGPYGHAGRSITPYDNTLPAVPHIPGVPGVRSMSFEASRRAVSRA